MAGKGGTFWCAGPILLLLPSATVSAIFFVGFWGRNAEALGAHDLGWALTLAFTVPVALYASMLLASATLVGVLIALRRGRSRATFLFAAALAISLLPIVFLAAIDAVGSVR